MTSRLETSRCKYCHKELLSDSALKRHIAATPKCKEGWEKEIRELPSDPGANQQSKRTHLEYGADESRVDEPNRWDDLHAFVPEACPEPVPPEAAASDHDELLHARKISDTRSRRFVEAFPGPVAIPVGQGKTKFQLMYERQVEEGQDMHSLFANEQEWELAQWLSRRVGQKGIDEYLKLSMVSGVIEFN